MRTKAIIENFINGNLTDAQKGAERASQTTLYKTLRREYGKNHACAFAISQYLKKKITFQECSNIELGSSSNEANFSK